MKDAANNELLYEENRAVGVVTFNRPAAHNALTFAMYDRLGEICAGLAGDGPVKALIVTGAGDLLGFPKSAATNFVVRHVRRQVPEWSLPEAVHFNYALSQGRYENRQSVEVGPEDIAFLQYTGGTTGVSKGAVLTHRNLVANVLQLEAWFAPGLADAEDSMIVGGLPMYHVFALTQTLFFLDIGGCNLLIANPRDFPAFVAELRRNRFTFFSGVPAEIFQPDRQNNRAPPVIGQIARKSHRPLRANAG